MSDHSCPSSLPTLHPVNGPGLVLTVRPGPGGEGLLSFLTKSWGFSSIAFNCPTSTHTFRGRRHFTPLWSPQPLVDSTLVIPCVRKLCSKPRPRVPACCASPQEAGSDVMFWGDRWCEGPTHRQGSRVGLSAGPQRAGGVSDKCL